MRKDLDTLEAQRDEYDLESRTFIDSLRFVDKEISDINSMKRTAGWKVIEKKARQELQQRITVLVEKDSEVRVLLALLHVADTKSQAQQLDEEILKILPEPSS